MHGRGEHKRWIFRGIAIVSGRVHAHRPAPVTRGVFTGTDFRVEFFDGVAHALESTDEDSDISRTWSVHEHGADRDGVEIVSVSLGLELFDDGRIDSSGDGSSRGGVDFERSGRIENFRPRD